MLGLRRLVMRAWMTTKNKSPPDMCYQKCGLGLGLGVLVSFASLNIRRFETCFVVVVVVVVFVAFFTRQ